MTTTHPSRPKPATKDHLKKKKKPSIDVNVCLDPELAVALEKAQAEVDEQLTVISDLESQRETAKTIDADAVTTGIDEKIEEAKSKLAELEAAAAEAAEAKTAATEYIRVQSIGRKKYDKLVEAHPPTDEQVTEWQKENPKDDGTPGASIPEYNGDTFPIALISKCAVEPVLSEDEVEEITEDWNFNEFMQLFMACIAVNSASRVESWGKAYG